MLLIVIVIVVSMKYRNYNALKVNSKMQMLIEIVIDFFSSMVEGMLGKKYVKKFLPLTMTMYLIIFFSNLTGLIFMKEAAMLNPIFPFVWSIGMFLSWSIYAIIKTGVFKFLKNAFIGEVSVLAPIETLGFLSKPISLGARMLGNVTAGSVIMMLVWQLPVIVTNLMSGLIASNSMLSPIIALFNIIIFGIIGGFLSLYFSVFGPFIQATVFTYLVLGNFAALLPEEEK